MAANTIVQQYTVRVDTTREHLFIGDTLSRGRLAGSTSTQLQGLFLAIEIDDDRFVLVTLRVKGPKYTEAKIIPSALTVAVLSPEISKVPFPPPPNAGAAKAPASFFLVAVVVAALWLPVAASVNVPKPATVGSTQKLPSWTHTSANDGNPGTLGAAG